MVISESTTTDLRNTTFSFLARTFAFSEDYPVSSIAGYFRTNTPEGQVPQVERFRQPGMRLLNERHSLVMRAC